MKEKTYSKKLTKIEKEVLKLNKKGLTEFAISKKLNMPEPTIHHCLDNIYKKLNGKQFIKEDICGKKSLITAGFVLIISILLIGLVSASLNVQLSDQGTGVAHNNGTTLGSADLTVLIYDALSGGNLIYNETFISGISQGSWNVMLGAGSVDLPLEYGKVYYKDYLIAGEDTSFDGNDRQVFYSPLGDISDEDISPTINITTTGYGFFGWLGNLLNRITGLFVVDIDASGNINASNYTLNGTTIDDWSDVQATGTDTHVAGTGYLYNDSTTMYLNETQLNETIDSRAVDLTNYALKNQSETFADNLTIQGTVEIEGDLNMTSNNITTVDCITFISGGKICNSP